MCTFTDAESLYGWTERKTVQVDVKMNLKKKQIRNINLSIRHK